ncbi:MAG: TVP38/TMEM64 family protein [Deltaproteobacteria bacterium]|nr:TVP38/TMEM64 family protein [Deltaproteobacteria bacterium]
MKDNDAPMDVTLETKDTDNGKKANWRDLWRPISLLVFVAAMIILTKIFGWGEQLGNLRQWIQSLGAWGPVVYVLIYILSTVAALPGVVISIIGGAIYGSFLGVILVSIGSTLGASLAFLIARYFARGAVVRWLSKDEKFSRLDEMTEKHGAVIVAIVRLIPLFPFDLLNYGFGLTRIPFRTYVLWSWLCMLPGTVLYVVGADAVSKAIVSGGIPWPLIIIVMACAVLLFLLARYAYRILNNREKNIDDQ